MTRPPCESAAETAQWLDAIVGFLKPLGHLTDAHLVNFFKDRLWDSVDPIWIDCLAAEPVETLLRIPSGSAEDHWPESLRRFVGQVRTLSYPRQPPPESGHEQPVAALKSVLCQGMSPKKKHEVEAVAARVSSLLVDDEDSCSSCIIDVGAGQGYLSQVLSFHYNHRNVVAVDASSHHGSVTDARARRISRAESESLSSPKTVTCRVASVESLNVLVREQDSSCVALAGLHACGDLSVTMLQSFLECKQVKGIVSIGCCYNLLSKNHGFPVSRYVKSTGFTLEKNSRDLACQSAERWRCLDTQDGTHNFELHAFRAAFQVLLQKFYPQVMMTSPSIGRQGKALKRKGILESDDRRSLFTAYCRSGLTRLGLEALEDVEYHNVWNEVQPFLHLIGPYCSLRAALGPLLETLILLDRLLLLQEQSHFVDAVMLPIFDPQLSPRNLAIIAKKIGA